LKSEVLYLRRKRCHDRGLRVYTDKRRDTIGAENDAHIVLVAAIPVEPTGLYGGKQTNLDATKQ
jgi:hypothetical protein